MDNTTTPEPQAPGQFAEARGSANSEDWWTRKATELSAQMHLGGVKRFAIQVTPKGSYKFEVVPMPMKRRRIECPACGKTVSVSTKGHVHCHHLKNGAWCNMSSAYLPNGPAHRPVLKQD